MGENNTIGLLTSINGYLKTMVENTAKNKDPKQQQQNTQQRMTSTLNKGVVTSGAAVDPSKKEKGKFGDIAISAATLAALNNLPVIIKALAKLQDKEIKAFSDVLKALSTSLKDFVEGSDEIKGADNLVKTVTALEKLQKTGLIKMAITFKLANALGFTKSLEKLIIGINAAANKAGKMKGSNIQKFKTIAESMKAINSLASGVAIVMGTVVGLAVAMKVIPTKDIMVSLGITLLTMTALSGLAIAVARLSGTVNRANKDINAIPKFIFTMQVLTLTTLLLGVIAEKAWPAILTGFVAISGIILGYTMILALTSALVKFIHGEKQAMAEIFVMAAWGMALTLGTLLIGYVAQQAWPDILAGFVAISGVILGYVAIAAVVSTVAKLSNTFNKDVLSITLMAGLGMGLVLGTLLIGYVAQLAWPEIAIGFTTIGLVIGGYALLGKEISTVAKGLAKSQKDFLTLGIFAAACEGLLLGAVAIAWVTKKSGVSIGEILLTLTGVGLIAAGLGGIAYEMSMIDNKSLMKAIPSLKQLALFAAACEGLLAGVIGLAYLMQKSDKAMIAVTMATLTGIVYGITRLSKYLEGHNRTLKSGVKNMYLVAGIGLAAEAVLAGAVLLAKNINGETAAKTAGVFVVLGGIIYGLVGVLELIKTHNKDILTGAKSMLMVAGVALAAEAILGGAILLAKALSDKTIAAKTAGVMVLTGSIVLGLVGVLKLIEQHNKSIQKGAKNMLMVEAVALGAEAILLGAIGLAALQQKAGVGEGELLGVMLNISLIILGVVGIVKLVEKHNKDLMKGAKSLAMVEAVAAGAGLLLLGVIGLVKLKQAVNASWEEIYAVVGTMTLIVTAFGVLAKVASSSGKQAQKGIVGIGAVVLFAAGAALLLGGIIGLVGLKNQLKVGWDDVFISLGAMTAIVVAFGLLAFAVGQAMPYIAPGLPGIGIICLFALGAGALLAGVIGLVGLKNELKADWGDIFITVGAMATIVGAFGLLGAAVGLAAPFIVPGLASIGIITLFAGASELLLAGVIGLVGLKNHLKVDWKDVDKSIEEMATIAGLFGLLGTAVGLASPFITLGLAGIGAITLFAASSELLLGGVIELVDRKNKAKASWEDIDKTVDSMASLVTKFGILGTASSLAMPFILAGTPGLLAAIAVADNAAALLGRVITVAGLAKNLGPNGWEQVEKTVAVMTRLITNDVDGAPGFKELSQKAAWSLISLKAGGAGLQEVAKTAALASKSLIEVCKAAELAKNFSSSDVVDVIKKTGAITDALNDLITGGGGGIISTVFGGMKFAVKAAVISRSKGDIKDIADTAIYIANMLSRMAGVAKEGGLIRPMVITKSGDVKYGQWVNASGSAETIANTMCGFADTLYDTFQKMDETALKNIENGMKVIGRIMDPVSTFARTMASFLDAGEGKIRELKYDDKGKLIDTPAIDIKQVAGTIAGAISTFCQTLFSPENASVWEEMTKGGQIITNVSKEGDNTSTESVYEPGAAGHAMGILATVISPIGNFASTLAMFEDAEGDNLVVPVYDQNGKVSSKRTIDVKKVADKIATAVTVFIKGLQDRSKDWLELYKANNYGSLTTYKSKDGGLLGSDEYSTLDTRGNYLKDSMGVFATVITPVVSFANMLKMFGDADAGKLVVFNEKGEKRIIDPSKIATSIATAVTAFIKTLGDGVAANKNLFTDLKDNTDAMASIMEQISKSITDIGDIKADNLTSIYDTFVKILNTVHNVGEATEANIIKNATANISSLSQSLIDLSNEGAVQSSRTVNVLQEINSALIGIGKNKEGIDNITSSIGNLDKAIEVFSEHTSSTFLAATNSITGAIPGLKETLTTASDIVYKTVTDKQKGIVSSNTRATVAINKTRLAISNFDRVLNTGSQNRVKNIRMITDALRDLNNQGLSVGNNLGHVVALINALNRMEGSNASNLVAVLQALVPAINAAGSAAATNGTIKLEGGGGGGGNVDAIAKALAAALDGLGGEIKYSNDKKRARIEFVNTGSTGDYGNYSKGFNNFN